MFIPSVLMLITFQAKNYCSEQHLCTSLEQLKCKPTFTRRSINQFSSNFALGREKYFESEVSPKTEHGGLVGTKII